MANPKRGGEEGSSSTLGGFVMWLMHLPKSQRRGNTSPLQDEGTQLQTSYVKNRCDFCFLLHKRYHVFEYTFYYLSVNIAVFLQVLE